MGQLRNMLRGLGGDCTRGLLPRGRRGRSTKHTDSCPECAARQWRERQYLERMRNASIPPASEDFTARLLARTQQLATEPGRGSAVKSPSYGNTGVRNTAHRDAVTGSPALRALALAAGGAVAAAGIISAAAYFVAGEPRPRAEAAPLSMPQQEAAFGLRAAAGQPLPEAAGMLSAADLEGLRTRGWSCPELRDLGFHLLWARHEAVAGQPVLEMRLTDGKHFATVLEQHPQTVAAGAVPLAVPVSSPTNILTGHPAADDGFVRAPGGAGTYGGAAAMPPGALWINASAPWRAIYAASGVTFTYVSDLPADAADDGVAELLRAGAGSPLSDGEARTASGAGGSTAAGQEGLSARLQRGLSRLVELFTS
jgi:anti-sigma factor RsiW